MGVTGISCARYLRVQGVSLRMVDSREQPPMWTDVQQQFADCDLRTGNFKPEQLMNVNRVLLSPGISLSHPFIQLAIQRGIEVIGDIELFAQHVNKPVIAITGSNGKSTVTTLLGEMLECAGLKVAVGGNLGTPALDLLPDSAQQPDLYVLELSSFQLESTFTLAPRAAVILNISPDHLDRYSGLDDYAKAKQRIYRNAELQIVNLDDAYAARLADANRPSVGFGVQPPLAGNYGVRDVAGRSWLMHGEEPLLPATEIRMAGRHNLSNALAALALGDALGLDREAMFETLRTFGGLPHRTQWVAERDGVVWYNDSKGTNIGATLAAVQGMDRPVVLIAGGLGKGADFRLMRDPLMGRLRAAVLIGEDAPLLEAALQDATEIVRADSMESAVRAAAELAQPGDAVLLAPACASFDMFNGYDHRGDVFMDAVRRLVK
jgi:UDP-N-acetylmuramoylalanine--D-glutamate ligase